MDGPFGTQMRLFEGGRALKRWRYVGVFCDELMACAALVQIGPARQSFWALWRPAEGRLRERTRLRPRRGEVELTNGRMDSAPDGSRPGRVHVADKGVALDLALQEEPGIQATCAHGKGRVWTRKQAGVTAHGLLSLDGGPAAAVTARAVIDDTAGYHSRHTEWWWTAGVGESPDGVPLAWNLVRGVNDPASGSERAVWVAGQPSEAPPVQFAPDLASVSCEDGSQLRFRAEAQRARSDNLLLVRSDYRAPFGSFAGTLPGALPLAHGHGVVEHHRARW